MRFCVCPLQATEVSVTSQDVHIPGVHVTGGPGHWLASVHPTPGPPVRAPASQPSPAEALALVSNVAAWATNAQLAANLAVQSASPASASTAHSALVAVGRALATALAAYGHGHVAPHLELADEREAPADELEHVEEEKSASGSDSDGSSCSDAVVTPLRKRSRPEKGVTTSG